MITGAFLTLLSGAFLMLRLGPAYGSFPAAALGGGGAALRRALARGRGHRGPQQAHRAQPAPGGAHHQKYYTQGEDADDLISIGTIGLIKGINTYRPDKGVRLATYASKCTENEILMHFRALKKTAGDVSLSESIDVDGDGNSLSLMDILAEEDDMADRLGDSEDRRRVREAVDSAPASAKRSSSACATAWTAPRPSPSARPPKNAAYRAATSPA